MPIGIQLQNQTLPPWLESLYKKLGELSEREALAAYTPYSGSRLEDWHPDSQSAFQMGRETGTYKPWLTRSQSAYDTSQQRFPTQAASYMNPYTRLVADQATESGLKHFKDNMLPAIESQFVSKGQMGSGRHHALANQMGLDLQKQMAHQQNEILYRGYDQAGQNFARDQERMLHTGSGFSQLGRMHHAGHLTDVATLGQQGLQQQALNQQGKDMAYNDYLRKLNYPREQLNQHGALVHGFPAPQNTASYTQSPQPPQLNTLGQLGSLAGTLYGAKLAGGFKSGGLIKRKKKRQGSRHMRGVSALGRLS